MGPWRLASTRHLHRRLQNLHTYQPSGHLGRYNPCCRIEARKVLFLILGSQRWQSNAAAHVQLKSRHECLRIHYSKSGTMRLDKYMDMFRSPDPSNTREYLLFRKPQANHLGSHVLSAFQACSSDPCGRIFTICAKPGTTRPLVLPAPNKAWFLARP